MLRLVIANVTGAAFLGAGGLLALAYRDPRSGEVVTVEQAVRVERAAGWTPRRGPAEVLCWGILTSGLLRHPMLVGWRETR